MANNAKAGVTSTNRTSLKEREKTEAELHYNTLITAIKWISASAAAVMSVLIAAASFFISQSLGDVHSELEKTKVDAKSEIQLITSDARRQIQDIQENAFRTEERMTTGMQNSLSNLRYDVDRTGLNASKQIENSKELAIIAARGEIQQVFSRNNLESFIVQVAKSELEGNMRNVAKSTYKIIEQARTDSLIDKLNDSDLNVSFPAYNALWSDKYLSYTPNQVTQLISFFNGSGTQGAQDHSFSLLYENKSPIVTDFFKQLQNSPKSYAHAFNYLTDVARISDMGIFEKHFANEKDKRKAFGEIVNKAVTFDRLVVLSVLNSRLLVDGFYNFMPQKEFPTMQANTWETTKNFLSKEEFDRTYLATKR